MAEGEKYKIIIVDDDDFLVGMYASKFGQVGVTVDVAKSGDSLFEKLHGGMMPDLLLLDIVIPGMSGIEILKKIRDEKLIEKCPIIMLTNQSEQKDIEETKKLNIQGYIVKSAATPSEVVSEVIKVLEENKKQNG